MRFGRKLLIVLLAFGLMAAACGDDDDVAPTPAPPPAATDAPPAATDAPPAATDAPPMATEPPVATEPPPPPPAEILADKGVDLEAKTITVGLLSDLTGPFGALVKPIVTGHEVYWEDVNANGGIEGFTVKLEVEDTGYVVDNHVQLYEELKDDVVAFGHSTGSPHTVAINESLQEDGILAIPLTWYSGWSDPALNANLVPHGINYCLEAMNNLDWIKTNRGGETVAIVSLPGDYGQDSAQGAKKAAELLGLTVVHDGEGTIIPGQDLKPVADAIVASGADIVYATATPGTFGEVYGQAIAQGFVATWSGGYPSWNPVFINPDTPFKDAIERDWIASGYVAPWSSEGGTVVRDLFAQYRPDAPPHDYYGEGVLEAMLLHQILAAALGAGDITQAGVLRAAKTLEVANFQGLAPNETYVGAPNVRVNRTSPTIQKPSQADLAAGGTGVEIIETNYVSPTAANYVFEEACFKLG